MYRFVEHTAELEVELEAESPEALLGDGLKAIAELTGTGDGELVERRVELEASDLPALLAAWLDELVFVAETEGLLAEDAQLEVVGSRVTGTIRGRRGEPRPLVKAVTLHRLRFRQQDGLWQGRVVLDV